MTNLLATITLAMGVTNFTPMPFSTDQFTYYSDTNSPPQFLKTNNFQFMKYEE